jgi:twitching motility protein PilI
MPESVQVPFQLLLEIAARARSGNEGVESRLRIQPHWTGVGFSLLGQRLVAPMGEVTEILIVPPLTRLPRVQPWVRGVANVRGRLLPVIAFAEWLGERPAANWRRHRALVVEAEQMYCGLVVDEVFGLKHFAADALRGEQDGVHPSLTPFIEGAYLTADGEWSLFRPSRLIRDTRFLDAAR